MSNVSCFKLLGASLYFGFLGFGKAFISLKSKGMEVRPPWRLRIIATWRGEFPHSRNIENLKVDVERAQGIPTTATTLSPWTSKSTLQGEVSPPWNVRKYWASVVHSLISNWLPIVWIVKVGWSPFVELIYRDELIKQGHRPGKDRERALVESGNQVLLVNKKNN